MRNPSAPAFFAASAYSNLFNGFGFIDSSYFLSFYKAFGNGLYFILSTMSGCSISSTADSNKNPSESVTKLYLTGSLVLTSMMD